MEIINFDSSNDPEAVKMAAIREKFNHQSMDNDKVLSQMMSVSSNNI